MTALRGIYSRFGVLIHELAKFGVVGAVCYVVDVVVFNAMHFHAHSGPLTAKTVSTVVAASLAYFGNRHWSFKHRARSGTKREFPIFVALNAVGLGIALGCLGFTYYVLGLHDGLATNISGNVVGTGLGTVFRFWAYKRFVFLAPDDAAELDDSPDGAAALARATSA